MNFNQNSSLGNSISNNITIENFDLRLEQYFNQLEKVQEIQSYLKTSYLPKVDLSMLSHRLTKLPNNGFSFKFESQGDTVESLKLRCEGVLSSIWDGIKKMLAWLRDLFKTSESKSENKTKELEAKRTLVNNNVKNIPKGIVIFDPGNLCYYFTFKTEAELCASIEKIGDFLNKAKKLKTVIVSKDFSKDNLIKVLTETSDNNQNFPDAFSVWNLSENYSFVFSGPNHFAKVSKISDSEPFETVNNCETSYRFGNVLENQRIKISKFNASNYREGLEAISKKEAEVSKLNDSDNDQKKEITEHIKALKFWLVIARTFDDLNEEFNKILTRLEAMEPKENSSSDKPKSEEDSLEEAKKVIKDMKDPNVTSIEI